MWLIAVSRYMDKSGFSGSRLQTINGVFLLISFIGLRIVFGGYIVRRCSRSDSSRQTKGLTLMEVIRILQAHFPGS